MKNLCLLTVAYKTNASEIYEWYLGLLVIEDAGLPRLPPFLLPLSCPMSFSERLPLVPRIGFVEAKPADPDPPVKISSFLLFFLRASSLASSSEASRGRLSPALPPMVNAELSLAVSLAAEVSLGSSMPLKHKEAFSTLV